MPWGYALHSYCVGGTKYAVGRPVPIILFFLPIILFRISQNILLLFLRIDPIILIKIQESSKIILQHK